MIQRIYDLGPLVYDDLRKSYYERLEKDLFYLYENKKLSAYLAEHFPFTMRMQHDYSVVDESIPDRYVWMRRIDPDRDRSILIHWIPYSDSINISSSWLVKQRNRLAERLYEGDVIVAEETFAQQSTFRGRPALQLEGTWMNPTYVVGGPFRTIAFVDRESELIYLIDYYVRAIGERKKRYIDQLYIMASTFQTKSELNANKN